MSHKRKITFSMIWIMAVSIALYCYLPKLSYDIPENFKNDIKKLNFSSGYFDSTISTEKENYSMLEIIKSDFEFTSVLLGSDYFKYAFATHPYNFTGIIFESDPIVETGLIIEEYYFYLSEYNFNLSGTISTFYILLLYYGTGDGLDGIVCCYKEVLIYKDNVGFFSNTNNTVIDYNENIIFDGFFFCERNTTNVLSDYGVFYQIYCGENPLIGQILIFTDDYGRIDVYFKPTEFKQVGNFKIAFILNETQYFNSKSLELKFIVEIKEIDIEIGENTPQLLLLEKNQDTFLQYPVWVNTVINNEKFYDSEIHLKLKFRDIEFELLDLFNSSYFYLLALENVEIIREIEIVIESKCFIAPTLNLSLNATKRSVFFNLFFPKKLEIFDENPIKIRFEILDKIDMTTVKGLNEFFAIFAFNDSKWCEIPTELINENNHYYFKIYAEDLKIYTNFGREDFTFLISFYGTKIFKPQNSSVNIILNSFYHQNENDEPPLLILSPESLITLSIIGVFLSLASYFAFKVYKTRFKNEYYLKKLKI